MVGNTSFVINQIDKTDLLTGEKYTVIFAFIPLGLESAIPNNLSTIGKILKGRFDFSGLQKVRSLSKKGIWLDRAPTQAELKAMSNGKDAVFYLPDELEELMKQYEQEILRKCSAPNSEEN